MDIIYKDPKDLKDYVNNPRDNTGAIEPVMDSIKEFGFLVPVLITGDGGIIAGHTRKAAAVRLGLSRIPCICADGLTEEQVRAFRVVDNKTAEFASWDFERLVEELSMISDIDLEGFQFPDLGSDLQVSDEDFIQGTETVKEKKKKVVICPDCGREISL